MISSEEHELLVSKVFAYDYYTRVFSDLILKYTDSGKSCQTPHFWHDFWSALPDSPAIRRDPFFDVCDLAERLWDVED